MLITTVDEKVLDSIWELWDQFIGNLKSGSKNGLIFHADLDGIIGAAYILKALEKQNSHLKLYSKSVSTEEYHFKGVVEWCEKTNVENLIFADISIENSPEILERLSILIPGSIFIFDHHIIQEKGSLETVKKLFLANPTPSKLIPPQRPFPTFIFAQLLSERYQLSFPDWLEVIAIFSEGVEEFFESEVLESLKPYCKREISNKAPRSRYNQSELAGIPSRLKAGFETNESTKLLLDLIGMIAVGNIKDHKTFQGLLQDNLGPISKKISQELSKYIDEWKVIIVENELYENPVIFIPVLSRYSITGPVASILRGKFPNNIMVSYSIIGDTARIELRTRNDSGINFVKILGEIFSDSALKPENFGGHPTAAGVLISKTMLGSFFLAMRIAFKGKSFDEIHRSQNE